MSTQTINNPLLSEYVFFPYADFKAEHIMPAVETKVKVAKEKLEEILTNADGASELTFKNTLGALNELEDYVEKAWTPVENMLSLNGTDEIREASEKARPILVEFFNEYSLDERVYDLVKKYSESADAKTLNPTYKRYLTNTLRDFKLSGAELADDDKQEFKKLNLKLAELSQKFSNNSTDSKFNLIITDENDLSGLPDDVISAAKTKAKEIEKPETWVFNLDYPSYIPFMKFADNGELRKTMYMAFLNKGTSRYKNSKGESVDNEPLIQEIYSSKTKKAKLLGFKNYAEMSLASKMAESPAQVTEFLERLGTKARPLADKEYAELVAYQEKIGYENSEKDSKTVYPWDKEYLSEKLKKANYDIDTNLTKPYFELESCKAGMFEIASKLFKVSFKLVDDKQIWHPEVEVYEIYDNELSKMIGLFYMDLYPRDLKRQGAWVMPLVQGEYKTDEQILPQCALVCNLNRPQTEPKPLPSLLNHTEVATLFHEFGHALHHLLSKVELAAMSGTDVEWDFVELPSQFMENFTWEKESLSLFAKHYETNEIIPDELLNKMLKARNFNEGIACIRQIEFALFDLAIYTNTDDQLAKAPNAYFKEICEKYGVFKFIEGTNFPNAFGHIFAGGYAAGYYSYKWAEVLEADCFDKLKQAGVLNTDVGLKYKHAILEKGDSKAPMELFIDFMGRKPDENALLKRMGL
jgi:Zn-dependent oligopeptidase